MKKLLLIYPNYWRLAILVIVMLFSFNGKGQTILNESFNSNIPTSWTINNANSDSYLFKSPAQYGIGGTTAYAAAMGCSNDYLITPQLNITSANFALSYDAAVESATYKYSFKIMVSTTTTDPASFTEIADIVDFNQTTWTKNSISLAAYNGQSIYIAFYVYAAGSTSWSFGFDNIKVEALLNNELNAKDLTTTPAVILTGDEVTFTASISNDGVATQSDVVVDFKLDGSSIGTQTIASIASGATETAQITWTAAEGSHAVSFSLPSDDYPGNNTFSKNINVLGENSLFENFEGTWPPTGWTVNPSASSWQQYSFNQYEGTKCAYVSSSAGKRLITPKLTIDATSSISFYGKTGFGTYSIKLQYSTDKSSWTDVPSGSISLNATYAQYTVDLSTLTAGNYFIAFDYELSYTSIYIDLITGPDKVVETPQAAINPSPANTATDQSILPTLSWSANTSGGIPSGYKIYIGTDGGGTVTPTDLVNGTSQSQTSYTISSPLAYSTAYYWQIVPTNSEGDATSCPIWSFTTMADPTQPLPYSENFESGTTPNGWNLNNFSVLDYGTDASKSLSVDMSYIATASATTCPVGPLTASSQIVFDYRLCVPTFVQYPQEGYILTTSDNVQIMVSEDGGNNFTTVETINKSTHTVSTAFAAKYITLGAGYSGKNIVIKIVANTGGGDFQVDIDNLMVRETPVNPIFTINETAIDFGYLCTIVNKSDSVKITNTGGGTLTINDGEITITGTNASDFTLATPSMPVSLTTGQSAYIKVSLSTSTAGMKSAALNIIHNATGSPETVNINAETYEPLASFTEDFETAPVDGYPQGWNIVYSGWAYAGVIDNASKAHSGTKLIEATKWSSDYAYVVTPVVTNISQNRLKFWAKSTAAATSISVGTITDPDDQNTYTEFMNVPLTTAYAQYIVDFSGYTGTDYYLAFKTPAGASNPYLHIDDVVWEALPTQPVLGVSTSSVSFGMTVASDTISKTLTIKNEGVGTLTINQSDLVFSGTNMSDYTIDESVVFPIELSKDETYDISVLFIPENKGTSSATLTINHNGSNDAIDIALNGSALPQGSLLQDFNSVMFPPLGWTAESGWQRQTFGAYEGVGHAYFSPTSTATEVKLVTPKLKIDASDSLVFYTKTTATSPYPVILVMYSESQTGPWTQIGSDISISSSSYQKQTVQFTGITEGKYYIAIAASSGAFKSTYLDYIFGPKIYSEPEFTSTPVTNATSGILYTYNITTSDNDGDNAIITATTKPDWLTLTDNGDGTAVLTGTPDAEGNFDVSLTVDDRTTSVNQDFAIHVAQNTYAISFSVVGSNGTLAASVDAIPITTGDQIIEGKDVVFSASPATGYKVKEWTHNSVLVTGNTSNSYTYASVNADANITVEFEVIPSNDATLTDLKVDGTTITDFSAETLVYTVELPYGTATVPSVTATATDADAEVIVNNATALPGTASVVVTAEDETTTNTYTVNFTIAANTDAALSDLKVNGSTVNNFSTTTLEYNVELPYGTTTVPNVTATANDTNADVVVNNATTLPGTTTIVVTAEDETTTKTYTVNFTIAAPNSDATLSNIYVDNAPIPGFDSATETYNMELAAGTTTIPAVTATASHDSADVQITNASSLPGATTIEVTAQDGTTIKTYTVNFSVATGLEVTLEESLTVFPIPSNGELTVDLGYNIKNTGKWTLSNLNGQVVNSGIIDQSRFMVRNYSRGVYILTITIDQFVVNKKVIIE